MSSLDYLDLCRLCLVKDRVSVPIFEGEGDVRQIFLKIAACLPVKVGREDKLPKKICDDCVYKVELFYQFWNTTANAEKQLLQWLGEVSLDDKQGYVTGPHPSLMKPGQNPGENRLDGSVMQQVNDHPNNMGMGMLDSMGMGMPMMISTSGQQQQPQQQMTSVPMDTGGVQTVQAVPGPSTQSSHDQITQQKASGNQEDDEDESEEDENSDDECDGDDGLPVKEESEEDPNSSRTIEPTTFVNVSLACDEAGPSGLQQQKIGEMPEMVMPPTDGDPKSGYVSPDQLGLDFFTVEIMDNFYHIPTSFFDPMAKRPSVGNTISSVTPKTNNVKVEEQEVIETLTNLPITIKLEPIADIVKEEDAKQSAEEFSSDKTNDDVISDEVTRKFNSPVMENLQPIENVPKVLKKRDTTNISEIKKRQRAEKRFRAATTNELIQNTKLITECRLSNDFASDKSPFSEELHVETENMITTEPSSSSTTVRTITNTQKSSNKENLDMENVTIISSNHSTNGARILTRSQIEPVKRDSSATFSNKTPLTNYMVNHSFVKPFKCKICKSNFKKKSSFDTHMDTHYRIKYKCNKHPRVILTKLSVRNDDRKIHQNDFQYNLDQYEKIFTTNGESINQKNGNHGNKMFICEFCGKSFAIKKSFTAHKRRTHKIVKRILKKDNQCKICGKKFISIKILQRHICLHMRKFICTYCDKQLSNKAHLQVHMRLHTGERPFKCNFCSKDFTTTHTLRIHRFTHTNARPYLCDICGQKFNQRSVMMVHRKKHPGNHRPPPRTALKELDGILDKSV